MQTIKILILQGLLISIMSCSSADMSDDSMTKAERNKIDPRSYSALLVSENEGLDKTLSIVVLLDRVPDEEIQKFFSEQNIKTTSRVGKIITGKAKSTAVRNLVKQKYVKKIDINGKVQPAEEE